MEQYSGLDPLRCTPALWYFLTVHARGTLRHVILAGAAPSGNVIPLGICNSCRSASNAGHVFLRAVAIVCWNERLRTIDRDGTCDGYAILFRDFIAGFERQVPGARLQNKFITDR